jgi:hypothetical protein
VNDAGLDGLVGGGVHVAQGFGGLGLLSLGEQFTVTSFQSAEVGNDAAIVQVLALTVAHAAFGGLRIRHRSVR